MGVCVSKMKEVAGGVDKEAIEMNVKSHKIEIANKTKAQVSEWQSLISQGQSVSVSAMEVLPQKDLTKMKLQLDATSTAQVVQTTALYVATNTLYRDQLKVTVWNDVKAGMVKQKLPEQVITASEKAIGPIVDAALDKQVETMADAASRGLPLVTEEDVQAVAAYQAKHPPAPANDAAAGAAKDGGAKDEQKWSADDKARLDKKSIDQDGITLDTNPGEMSKDASAGGELGAPRGQFEQNQGIRA